MLPDYTKLDFYITNEAGAKIFTGNYDECRAEMDRLVSGSANGHWFMYDETDPDIHWMEAEVKDA